MKKNIILFLGVFLLFSCNSVRVVSDYDSKVDFTSYKTFAFYKPEIDKAKISDLDKKRILRAIETALLEKGFTKSDTPDMLVGIFAKSREKVTVNQNNIGFGWGWGWNPWMWGSNQNTVSSRTEGVLYIDLIDAKTKQLVWQGKGKGGISEYTKNRDERIGVFVAEILKNYPPESAL